MKCFSRSPLEWNNNCLNSLSDANSQPVLLKPFTSTLVFTVSALAGLVSLMNPFVLLVTQTGLPLKARSNCLLFLESCHSRAMASMAFCTDAAASRLNPNAKSNCFVAMGENCVKCSWAHITSSIPTCFSLKVLKRSGGNSVKSFANPSYSSMMSWLVISISLLTRSGKAHFLEVSSSLYFSGIKCF